MDLRTGLSVTAIAVALAIVPVLGMDVAQVPRDVSIAAVSDGDGYLGTVVHNPQLCLLQDDKDGAITVHHNYTSGVDQDVVASESTETFEITNPDPLLSADESHTFKIKNTNVLGSTGIYSIDVTLNTTVEDGGQRIGFATMTRTVTTEVLSC